MAPIDITTTPEWDALAKHHAEVGPRHLRELFAEDPDRGRAMAVEAADLYLDYSKHRATAETVRLLVALAERAGLRDRIDGDVRRRAHQRQRGPGRAAHGAAAAARTRA